MASKRAFASALVAFAATTTIAATSHAFCRTTTVSIAPDFNPRPGICWNQGLPLWWKNACVSYNLQKDASRQIALDTASEIIADAFTKWTGASCPTDGGGSSRPSIDVRYWGPVDCGEVQYNSDAGNQHVIVFRDENWPHNDANNTLALTTVTFNPDTGEIYDADMEINTAQQTMSTSDVVPPQGYDFRSVVTHETGHFLGLAHSGDTRATMYAHYTQGSMLMRNITADDVEGICTIYTPSGGRAVDKKVSATGFVGEDACDPTPRKGFSTECKGAGSSTSGASCKLSIAGQRTRSDAALVALGAAACALFGRRRRASKA